MFVSTTSKVFTSQSTSALARAVLLRSLPGTTARAFSSIASSPLADANRTHAYAPVYTQTWRYQSSQADVVLQDPASMTNKLRVLNMNVVRQILEELKSVDVNSDGRINADELKLLLRKHDSAFTDEEIFEIGELFYAGKSGGSVSFDRFVEAIDRVVQLDSQQTLDTDVDGNPMQIGKCGDEYLFYHSHGNYTKDDLDISLTHTEPQNFRDRLAFNSVKLVRKGFDSATSWNYGNLSQENILRRVIYLETIAAVPGMVAAIVRHLRSLRSMERDGGMMQMFLDEATNERMHLLTFVRMKDPSRLFRAAVIAGQFGFGTLFGLAYVISPKFCHRFVGYVEEEACATYTKIIHAIETADETSDLAVWRTELAPRIARSYWKLGENGTILDLMYAVRADEAEHRDVNHLCSTKEDKLITNPVSNTEQHLNTMLLKYVKDIMDRTPELNKRAMA